MLGSGRLTRRRVLAAGAMTVGAGMALATGARWRARRAVGQEPPAQLSPWPDLTVAFPNSVVLYGYDEATGRYIAGASSAVERPLAVAALGGDSYVMTATSLVRRDPTMTTGETITGVRAGALATAAGQVYFAANSSFQTYDRVLARQGQLPLDLPQVNKNAHDILVHENVAYLLDNVIMPIYVFRVDVSDPARPRTLERLEIIGVNQHLNLQWLNSEQNQWLVLAVSTTLAQNGYESTQTVHVFPMSGGDQRAALGIYRRLSGGTTEGRVAGVLVRAVSAVAPAWAVVDVGTGLAVAPVNTDGDRFAIGDALHLNAPAVSGRYRIIRHGERLFIAAGTALRVVDLGASPAIALAQEWDEVAVDMALLG